MAKRIASSSVDWVLLNKYIGPKEKPLLVLLKNKSDKYFRKVTDLPAELPKIDWNFYKNKITKPGMLEAFQKQYESLQIPYPGDNGLIALTEKREEEFKKQRSEDEIKIKKVLATTEAQLKDFSTRKKLSEMTNDEFYSTYPHLSKFDTDIYPVGVPDHNEKNKSH